MSLQILGSKDEQQDVRKMDSGKAGDLLHAKPLKQSAAQL